MSAPASKPLSVIQQSMWLDYRLAPASSAYNLVLALRIRSRHDAAALARAVERVGARHELLRTRFVEIDGEPRRVPSAAPLAGLDVVETAPGELRAAVRRYLEAPFDLSEGAFRVGLVVAAPDDAVLVPVVHHIAGDFVSHWLIVRDLLDACGGAGLPLPEADYDLYVAEEARIVASSVGERSRAYWSGRIGEAPAAELPLDAPRPALPRHVGATHKVRLDADIAERLPGAARALGATPFGCLLGAFNALLRQYTGLDDFLVGCPATSRLGTQLREVVGSFVNPMPIRARFGRDTTFRDAIAAASGQLRTGMLHVRYPCGLLAAGAPLFRIAVLLVAMDRREPAVPNPAAGEECGPEVEYAGMRVALMDVPSQEGQLDLVVRFEQSGAGIDMVCAYDTDLFEAATVERFAAHFQRFARAAVTEPDSPVAAHSLFGGGELGELFGLGGVWSE
ncbi:condensation domain-containing protein [Streptomyces sp. NPDC050560]|uniref:condensation domain-containing protein n=1 Tax=Streptomyces sp. NPDC050560 TaxID=3365630 RepID=UPI00379C9BA9